jgi:lipid A ethanolaminephosphotransferase
MKVRFWKRPDVAAFAVSVYLATVLNGVFWRRLYVAASPDSAHDWMFLLAVALALVAALFAVLVMLPSRFVFKPVVALVLIVSAAAAFFLLEYGAVIDETMLRNVFETDWREAGDLLTAKLVLFVAVLGVLPALLVWYWPIAPTPSLGGFFRRAGLAGTAVAVAVTAVMTFYEDVSTIARQHRLLRMSLVPSNLVIALAREFRHPSANSPLQPFARDARRGPSWTSRQRKTVTVLVIGETARAQNFSLNGYAKNTNPELSKIPNLVSFSNATSCGTGTAISVPCIFSGSGRDDFDRGASAARENLLDILQRTGFSVSWRDNQAGCKGVCARVPSEQTMTLKPPGLCEDGACMDEALLYRLGEKIRASGQDAVVVLHMVGSHGPAYYRRSPADLQVFQPACATNRLSHCMPEEVTNAYDNSLRYTDRVLARLIALLEAIPDRDAAMLYVSDHGESLGERGLYLHGTPYAFAPAEQTHVPLLLWTSQGYADSFGVDQACLMKRRAEPISHDNIFHSVLGMLDVKTQAYDQKLDIFAPCRAPDVSGAQHRSAG